MKKNQKLALRKDVIAKFTKDNAEHVKGGLPNTVTCLALCRTISCQGYCETPDPQSVVSDLLSNICGS